MISLLIALWTALFLGETGAPPADPPADPPDGGKSDPPKKTDEEPLIPKSRFDEVNREYQRMKAAEEKRVKADLEAKGEHEKIADQERARAEKAEKAAKSTALRSAFVTAAVGKVSDLEAAYRLADFGEIEVEITDDGEASLKGDMAKVIERVLKAHPILTPGPRSTGSGMGGPVSGAGNNPPDLSNLTSEQRMKVGLEQEISKLPPHRQGVFGGGRTE
jgi:hypothetical protein